VLLSLGALAVLALAGANDAALAWGSAIGAILAALIGLRLMSSLAFDFSWPPVLFAAAGLGAAVLAFSLSGETSYVTIGTGIVVGGLFCLLSLNQLRLIMRSPRPSTA